MVIEQTVDIPASRRLTLDVPREVPAGRVVLRFTPADGGAFSPLLAMRGIDRGKDTLDAYCVRKRADKAREDGQQAWREHS
jgi:hypothetical protein